MTARRRFNEGTALEVVCNFRSDGVATTPASVHWKLRNTTADTTVVDWTQVAAASEVAFDIAASYLAIVDDSNDLEDQELTVVANKDLTGQVPEVIRWAVVNLSAL